MACHAPCIAQFKKLEDRPFWDINTLFYAEENLKPFVAMTEPQSSYEKKSTEFEVESRDICMGIKILQLLMDSCPPGIVPDATVLGSVMGLVSIIECYIV